MERFDGQARSLVDLLPVAAAGFFCGAVIGFKVPWAYRTNLVTPPDPVMARMLKNLLAQAESTLGSKVAAENWVFTPNNELSGLTPAEAVQYQTHATGVGRLLDIESACRREEARSKRPLPVVIEGGRRTGRSAA